MQIYKIILKLHHNECNCRQEIGNNIVPTLCKRRFFCLDVSFVFGLELYKEIFLCKEKLNVIRWRKI